MLLRLWEVSLFSAGLGGGLGSEDESGLNRRETLAANLEPKPEVVSGVVCTSAPPEPVTEGEYWLSLTERSRLEVGVVTYAGTLLRELMIARCATTAMEKTK